MDKKLEEIVSATIGDKLNDSFRRGCIAGWYAFACSAYEKVKGFHSVKEAKSFFKEAAEDSKKKLEEQSNVRIE